LEIEGVVKKGYFIEGDDTLYWMNNSDINDLVNHGFDFTFSQNFIVSPHDQLATYLAPFMRKHFGMGSCYIIFHGLDITGAFKIKQKNKKIWITEFKGNEEDWGTVEKYFRENRLELVDEESEKLYTYNDDL
jgi:hypothetical protein